MCALLKKTPLEKRMKQLEKELASVDNDIRALAKGGRKASQVLKNRRRPMSAAPPGAPPEVAPPPEPRQKGFRQKDTLEDQPAEVRQVKRIAEQIRDDRFVNYLATNLESTRPLRHERKMKRNKAILMLILAVLALLWVLNSFLK